MNILSLSIILVTVFLSACAQLVLKLGVGKAGGPLFEHGVANFFGTLFSPFILSGIALYGISVLLWIWVLSKVDLSLAYPFVGVSFIFTLLFGAFILNENVGHYRILGTLLIAIGCVLVARS